MKNTNKITFALLSILGLWYLLKDKVPPLEITSTTADAIEFKFNKAIRQIKKNVQDSYKAGKYVLVALSDRNGVLFTIYKDDKAVKKVIALFNN